MIHEVTIAFTVAGKNGERKTVKEQYLVDNRNLFAEVEDAMYVGFDGYKDIDVIAVKRSRIKEIINTRQSEDDLIWMAELQDTFVDDDGKEKYIKYKVVLYSKTFDTAKAFISEYIKQGCPAIAGACLIANSHIFASWSVRKRFLRITPPTLTLASYRLHVFISILLIAIIAVPSLFCVVQDFHRVETGTFEVSPLRPCAGRGHKEVGILAPRLPKRIWCYL